MPKKTRHISILQFDEQLFSLLRVTPSPKGLDVVTFAQKRGSWPREDGSLQRALRTFINENNTAHDKIYTVLPRYEMTSRIITLPTQDPSEIDGMIRFSAEEYVPFSSDDIIIDYCTLEKLADGESRVLAVFVHRDIPNAQAGVQEGPPSVE